MSPLKGGSSLLGEKIDGVLTHSASFLLGSRPPRLRTMTMQQAWSQIRAIISDVDGVLTDGTVWHDADGEALKPTHSRDGYMIKAGRAQGLTIGICTGRQ